MMYQQCLLDIPSEFLSSHAYQTIFHFAATILPLLAIILRGINISRWFKESTAAGCQNGMVMPQILGLGFGVLTWVFCSRMGYGERSISQGGLVL
jgi:hypothetical protein